MSTPSPIADSRYVYQLNPTLNAKQELAIAGPNDQAPPQTRLWPQAWAGHLAVEADAVEAVLRQAMTTDREDAPSGRLGTVATIRALAQRAVLFASADRLFRRPGDWWRGTSVETGYAYLHAAKTLLVDVVSESDLDAMIVDMRARLQAILPAADARRQSLDALDLDAPLAIRRASLKRATHLCYEIADAQHSRVRQLRNLLLAVCMLLTIFVALVALVASRFPTEIPLCFSPTPGGVSICPAGGSGPASTDVFLIVGIGMLGGALAATVAIRKLQPSAAAYDVPLALALLKLPTGALTALVGILLIGGAFVPGLSDLDNQQQIMAYALLFGYGQQVATRLVDRHARSVLSDLPRKDGKTSDDETPPLSGSR